MPEGHVSHRNALRLTAALVGKDLVRVETPEPRLGPQRIPERLDGDRVANVEAAGKHHLVTFASGRVLHSHLGMNGSWRVSPAREELRRGGLWLLLGTPEVVVAQYRGPTLRLYEPGEQIRPVAGLGQDLLGDGVDGGSAMAGALERADPIVCVGEALLDQRLVSGIGNIYKNEALFLCGIDPWRPVGSIAADEARALGETARGLLREAMSNPGHVRWVYRRARRPCRRCGTPIVSRGQGDANRTTYWCPRCQV
jgi:endonuclease-8